MFNDKSVCSDPFLPASCIIAVVFCSTISGKEMVLHIPAWTSKTYFRSVYTTNIVFHPPVRPGCPTCLVCFLKNSKIFSSFFTFYFVIVKDSSWYYFVIVEDSSWYYLSKKNTDYLHLNWFPKNSCVALPAVRPAPGMAVVTCSRWHEIRQHHLAAGHGRSIIHLSNSIFGLILHSKARSWTPVLPMAWYVWSPCYWKH
jgi:hypothetical protein